MKGVGPVGVVGLLEKPEPTVENRTDIRRLGQEAGLTKICTFRQSHTSKAASEVANVSKWVQSVWLGLVSGGAVDRACGAGRG